MNFCWWLIIPRNFRSSAAFCGLSIFSIAAVLSGSVPIPWALKLLPANFNCFLENLHLPWLRVILALINLVKTASSRSSYFFASFHAQGCHTWCISPLPNLPARLAFSFGIFLVLILNQRGVAENNVCQRQSETWLGVESFLLASPAQTRNLLQLSWTLWTFQSLLARRQSLEVGKFHGKHFSLSFVRSTHIRIFPFGLDTVTISAHQFVGLSTFLITPSFSILASSSFTLLFIGNGISLRVMIANGWAPGLHLISYSPSSSPNP